MWRSLRAFAARRTFRPLATWRALFGATVARLRAFRRRGVRIAWRARRTGRALRTLALLLTALLLLRLLLLLLRFRLLPFGATAAATATPSAAATGAWGTLRLLLFGRNLLLLSLLLLLSALLLLLLLTPLLRVLGPLRAAVALALRLSLLRALTRRRALIAPLAGALLELLNLLLHELLRLRDQLAVQLIVTAERAALPSLRIVSVAAFAENAFGQWHEGSS